MNWGVFVKADWTSEDQFHEDGNESQGSRAKINDYRDLDRAESELSKLINLKTGRVLYSSFGIREEAVLATRHWPMRERLLRKLAAQRAERKRAKAL